MGDWNTHFECSVHSRVGDLVWPSMHKPAPATLRILEHFDLWLPSTFSGLHSGPSATWHAPSGLAWSRIDYVATPASWLVLDGASYTLPSLDLGHSTLDHIAVWLCVWAPRPSATRPGAASRVILDRQAMQSAEGQTAIRRICDTVPDVAWSVDASSHYHAVQTHLHASLCDKFAHRSSRCAKSFLTDATWVLRDKRNWLRRQACRARLDLRNVELTAAFRAWRLDVGLNRASLVVVASAALNARATVFLVQQLRRTKLDLRKALRADKRSLIASVAREALDIPTRDVVACLRPLLHLHRPKGIGARPLPAVRLEDGSLAVDGQAALDRWVRHFAANEGGARVSEEHFVASYGQGLLQGNRDPAPIALDDVPTRLQLERSMLDMVPGKSAGPDLIPPECVKYGSGALSRSLYKLFLKLALRLDEALIWKGGTLHRAWKGKGSPCEPSSHRGLLVSSVVGKALHATLRASCVRTMRTKATALQVGGLPRFPVLFPSHLVRLFQSWHRGQSFFLLFLDLREAFYRVCRGLLRNSQPSDEELAWVFQQLQLPPTTFADFRDTVSRENAFDASSASPWLASVMSEVMSHTWFKLPDQPDVVSTALGVRPGDALADTLFFLVFSRVLHETRDRVQEAGSMCEVPWVREMHESVHPIAADPTSCVRVCDTTWMDDLCIMAPASSAQAALEAIPAVSGALIDSCLKRGLYPNLSANKTECLVSLHGPMSRTLRRQLLSEQEPSLPCGSKFWGSKRLRIVPRYKHLGGLLHHKGLLSVEVKSRVAQAWSAFQSRRQAIFAQRHLPLADKRTMLLALVCPILFYGVGCWTCIMPRDVQQLETCFLGLCRALLRRHFHGDVQHLSPARVLFLVGAPSVETCVHVARLTYLRSFVTLDVPEAWALAHQERGWLQLVRESLAWMWEHVDAGVYHGSPDVAWPHWRLLILHHPRKWKRLVRVAQDVAARKEALAEGWQQCRGMVVKRLLGAGATIQAWSDKVAPACDPQAFGCGPCQLLFATRQRWAVHAFKSHGRVKEVRGLVPGRQCPCCLKQYASNISLCSHLSYSQRCRSSLQRAAFKCVPEPGIGSRHGDKGHEFLGAVKQAYGPASRLLEVVPEDLEERAAHLVLVRRIREVLECSDSLAFQATLEACRKILASICLSPEQVNEVLTVLSAEADEWWEDCAVALVLVRRRVLQWLTACWSAEWLCGRSQAANHAWSAFKHSEACLAALDFEHVDRQSLLADEGCGFLLCHETRWAAIAVEAPAWACTVLYEGSAPSADWVHTLWGHVQLWPRGLVLLLLDGLKSLLRALPGPLSAKGAAIAQAANTALQDAILVSFQLWERQTPFALVVSAVDQSVEGAMLAIPGLQFVRGDRAVLFYSCLDSALPDLLFHLI